MSTVQQLVISKRGQSQTGDGSQTRIYCYTCFLPPFYCMYLRSSGFKQHCPSKKKKKKNCLGKRLTVNLLQASKGRGIFPFYCTWISVQEKKNKKTFKHMLIFKYVINPTAVSCTVSCFRVQQQLDQGERQSQRFFQAFYFFF